MSLSNLCLFRCLRVICIMPWGLCVHFCLAQEQSASGMRDRLVLYDQEFLSSFSVKAEASIPYPMKDRDSFKANLDLTGADSQQFLRRSTRDLGNPKYLPQSKDVHDEEGNLLVQQEKESYIVLDQGKGTVRSDSQTVAVSPGGTVKPSSMMQPCLNKYPVNNDDARNLFYRYLLPLGRGYSGLLSRVDRVIQSSGSAVTVEGVGFCFSPHPGKWVLTVDTRNQYLVTRATFTRDGANSPTLVCQSEGVLGKVIPLGQKGTLTLGGYVISVVATDYARAIDESVKADVLKKVNVAPPEVLLIDYGVIDSDRTPLVVKGQSVPRDLPPEVFSGEAATPRNAAKNALTSSPATLPLPAGPGAAGLREKTRPPTSSVVGTIATCVAVLVTVLFLVAWWRRKRSPAAR